MKRMVVRAATALCLTLWTTTTASAECQVPKYDLGQVVQDDESYAFLMISMRIEDFSPQVLVCLSSHLRNRYRGRDRITIPMFSSPTSARFYQGDVEVGDYFQGEYYNDLHAVYKFDAAKHEDYLLIKPRGMLSLLPQDTRIDLPAKRIPRCRLELRGRCLLSMNQVGPADGVFARGMDGTVELRGTVTRDGSIAHVQVVKTVVSHAAGREAFVRSVVKDFQSWRLTPAPREDPVRITFAYVTDPALRDKDWTVDYALPDRITVRSRPR